MEATEDPLSALADIHLPADVSWWPPAPLWWLLAALVLAAIGYGMWRLFLRWEHMQRQKVALAEVSQALHTWQAEQATNTDAGLALLHSCNSILKRVALVHYPQADVAALHGRQWLEFLDRSGTTNAFTSGPASVLAAGSYRKQFSTDATGATAITAAVEQWIARQYLQQPRPGSSSVQLEVTA